MNVNQGSHDIKKTAEETFLTSDKIKTMGGKISTGILCAS